MLTTDDYQGTTVDSEGHMMKERSQGEYKGVLYRSTKYHQRKHAIHRQVWAQVRLLRVAQKASESQL